ncbi:MAG: heparan-alpha-glucosaminide N-acetyltransferase domain-containing protein [Cytophagales bacterium]|nr:heparan-alpha-glucosaminide N-acetyltransferase domain-containing protein [Cytophagales bacterium]
MNVSKLNPTSRARIESIDILRGAVMVIMALDHVRDYFYFGSFFNDPMNLETTTPILYFTRFISHFCAPIFVFLSGASAFLHGNSQPKISLSQFLFTRGLWLIFLEIVVNNLVWTFNPSYSLLIFQVIWTIGFCMVFLAGIIHLPQYLIICLGLCLIIFHNLLDSITMQGKNVGDIIWYLVHQSHLIVFSDQLVVIFHYPVLPWVGVMCLGYVIGSLYKDQENQGNRLKWLYSLGIGAIVLFFTLRTVNLYGNLQPWAWQDTLTKTMYSFFKVTKYPPSLDYILITIGPGLLFLAFIESIKNKATDFLLVFGRVPLFYYFLHVALIHSLAILLMAMTGQDWKGMIISGTDFVQERLINSGYPLAITYLVWIGIIAMLFPLCKWYMIYKSKNKGKWWLSYL